MPRSTTARIWWGHDLGPRSITRRTGRHHRPRRDGDDRGRRPRQRSRIDVGSGPCCRRRPQRAGDGERGRRVDAVRTDQPHPCGRHPHRSGPPPARRRPVDVARPGDPGCRRRDWRRAGGSTGGGTQPDDGRRRRCRVRVGLADGFADADGVVDEHRPGRTDGGQHGDRAARRRRFHLDLLVDRCRLHRRRAGRVRIRHQRLGRPFRVAHPTAGDRHTAVGFAPAGLVDHRRRSGRRGTRRCVGRGAQRHGHADTRRRLPHRVARRHRHAGRLEPQRAARRLHRGQPGDRPRHERPRQCVLVRGHRRDRRRHRLHDRRHGAGGFRRAVRADHPGPTARHAYTGNRQQWGADRLGRHADTADHSGAVACRGAACRRSH